MEERLLKSDEVAEILQVSRAKAYSLLQRGEIPRIRIGSLVRVGARIWSATSGQRLSRRIPWGWMGTPSAMVHEPGLSGRNPIHYSLFRSGYNLRQGG